MAVQRTAVGRRRWQRGNVLQLIMLMIVASLFSLATVQMWSLTGSGLNSANIERDGVTYLRPINGLLAELVEAQSAAVRGTAVQTAVITTAVSAVDGVDEEHGEAFDAGRRWADARKRINDLMTARPVGVPALDQYTEAISLVLQLGRHVADASKLALDPESGSFHLMDAAVIRLPEVIVNAGRAADLAMIGPADGSQQTRIFVARYNVATNTQAIGVGLAAKSLDTGDSRALGASVIGQLDAFRSAVDSFVPSGTRLQGLETADGPSLTRFGTAVRQAARSLADAVLAELDKILSDRAGTMLLRQAFTVGIAVLGLLVTLVLVLMAATRLRSGGPGRTVPGPRQQSGPPRGRPETQVIDPNDLLSAEEMLHIGAPARTIRQERGADAR